MLFSLLFGNIEINLSRSKFKMSCGLLILKLLRQTVQITIISMVKGNANL